MIQNAPTELVLFFKFSMTGKSYGFNIKELLFKLSKLHIVQ
jgi:hypothetical protein